MTKRRPQVNLWRVQTLRVLRLLGSLGFLVLPALAGLGIATVPTRAGADASAFLAATPVGRQEAPPTRESRSPAVALRKTRVLSAVPMGSRSGSVPGWRDALERPSADSGLRPAGRDSLPTELTKPAYLLVRLLATPTNHRAPPV